MVYNALGQRAERKLANAVLSEYVYDPQGGDMGHYDGSNLFWANEYVLFGGRILAYYGNQAGNDTLFFDDNALGSIMFGTNSAGGYVGEYLHDSWGNLWANTGNAWDARFASLPVFDMDLDLQMASHREYSSGQSRWLSPDPDNSGADPSNPQSWNAYSYAPNNPATNTDPSGLDCAYLTPGGTTIKQGGISQLQSQQECSNSGGYWVPGTLTDFSLGANGNYVFSSVTDSNSGDLTQHTTQYMPSPDAIPPGVDPVALLFGGIEGEAGEADEELENLAEDGANVVERMLGVGAEESTPAVATTAATVTPNVAEAGEVVQKAIGAVGNQSLRVSSESVARQAADEFVGLGATPALDRNTGQIVGLKSADGTRVAIGPHADGIGPHFNLKNLATGGNLHVRW